MMVCAICGEHLEDDGPMGWQHRNGSMYGNDGHAVVPITREGYLAYPRERPTRWRQ